eukprot:GEMP01061177.1.p2 GENE.GEMP01061177.1~~GEMP01061177.1.p2  ORF type:complete len:120 (-),score=7.41 GEMP01061177.1:690-1049(-)
MRILFCPKKLDGRGGGRAKLPEMALFNRILGGAKINKKQTAKPSDQLNLIFGFFFIFLEQHTWPRVKHDTKKSSKYICRAYEGARGAMVQVPAAECGRMPATDVRSDPPLLGHNIGPPR